MNEALLNTGVVVFILYAAVSIACQVNTYRAAGALRNFFRLSSGDMLATLAEVRATLESFSKISENVTVVTSDVRKVTSSVADLQKEVRTVYGLIRDGAGMEARADLAGLKAGIRTGVATLVKGLKEERSDDSEGRT